MNLAMLGTPNRSWYEAEVTIGKDTSVEAALESMGKKPVELKVKTLKGSLSGKIKGFEELDDENGKTHRCVAFNLANEDVERSGLERFLEKEISLSVCLSG
jgi:hypothetical protein